MKREIIWEKTKAEYKELQLSVATNDEKEQIQDLIDTTDELMTDYYNVKYCAVTRGISDVVYTELIAVVIAYFSAEGYKLSSELLTHMYNV